MMGGWDWKKTLILSMPQPAAAKLEALIVVARIYKKYYKAYNKQTQAEKNAVKK